MFVQVKTSLVYMVFDLAYVPNLERHICLLFPDTSGTCGSLTNEVLEIGEIPGRRRDVASANVVFFSARVSSFQSSMFGFNVRKAFSLNLPVKTTVVLCCEGGPWVEFFR